MSWIDLTQMSPSPASVQCCCVVSPRGYSRLPPREGPFNNHSPQARFSRVRPDGPRTHGNAAGPVGRPGADAVVIATRAARANSRPTQCCYATSCNSPQELYSQTSAPWVRRYRLGSDLTPGYEP